MIKLKTLILENEKLAFQMEKAGTIKYSVFNNDNLITITELSSDDKNLGRITLMSNTNDELGDIQPKMGYLYVDFIEVKYQGEGFGALLYIKALKYCQQNRYKGLVSGKDHRTGKTERIWDKIKTSEDEYYTYADVRELAAKFGI